MAARVETREEVRIGEGASTALLLAFLLLSVTGSVDAANWADGLSITAWAALGGLALGWVLAKATRLRGELAHACMLVLGIPATALFASSLLPGMLALEERLVILQERLFTWVSKVVLGGVSADNLIFVIQLAYLTWVMSYLAAWFVYRRHQVWGAILPSGAAIVFNLFYAAPQTGIYFSVYILCALLLIVRLNLNGMERWWRATSVGYASDIGVDFLTYGVLFSLLLMAVVWLLPASAPGPSWLGILEPFETPWQNVEDQFNRVFSSLRAVARPGPTTFFGTTLAMGGPVHLGNRPVMDITAETGRYWRAAVYDRYTGVGWMNTHLNTLNLAANDPSLMVPGLAMRAEVTQTIRIFLPDQNMLYAQSEPVLFSRPTEVRYGQSSLSDTSEAGLDVALVRSRRPLREGDTYSVLSHVSVAYEDSLRTSPGVYSEWMQSTYLQLPGTLPERVRELAETITADYTNPYDKATAIERYLRANITYNDDVSAPPIGRDGVDYMLFERPEGYCNYYASAMAVLARSIGIPARVASGYSLGDYRDGVFHVTEANAHSWVEVYFPGYGWIEFEPTSSKPEIERPKMPIFSRDEPGDSPSDSEATRGDRRNRELDDLEEQRLGGGLTPLGDSFLGDPRNLALGGAGLLALTAIGLAGSRELRRLRRLASLAPAARWQEELAARAQWLGVRDEKHATPFERARMIGDALPKVRGEIDRGTSLYVRERFGAHPLDPDERATLSVEWDKVRAEWRRALVAQAIERVVTPVRTFLTRLHRKVERWGKG